MFTVVDRSTYGTVSYLPQIAGMWLAWPWVRHVEDLYEAGCLAVLAVWVLVIADWWGVTSAHSRFWAG